MSKNIQQQASPPKNTIMRSQSKPTVGNQISNKTSDNKTQPTSQFGTPDYLQKKGQSNSSNMNNKKSNLDSVNNKQISVRQFSYEETDQSQQKTVKAAHNRSFSNRLQAETSSIKKVQPRKQTTNDSNMIQPSSSPNPMSRQEAHKKTKDFSLKVTKEEYLEELELKGQQQSEKIHPQTTNQITKTKYLKKIEQNIVQPKHQRPQKQVPQQSKVFMPNNKKNPTLSQSQSMKSFVQKIGNTTTIGNDDEDYFPDDNSMQQLQDLSFLNNNQHSNNISMISGIKTAKNQRLNQNLFKKDVNYQQNNNQKAFDKSKANLQSRNDLQKNTRSLSKSISEQKLITSRHVIQDSFLPNDRQFYEDELTTIQNPQLQNLLLSKNFGQGHYYDQDSQYLNYHDIPNNQQILNDETFRTLQNIESMIQQQTPSSSGSHRSQQLLFMDGQTFQEQIEQQQNLMMNRAKSSPQTAHVQPQGLSYKYGENNTNVPVGNSSQYAEITLRHDIPIEDLLQFLLSEEDLLNLCQSLIQQGQLSDLQQQLPFPFKYQYLDLLQSVDCKKERPKFFAQQLQVTLVLVNGLIQVFTQQYLQKFSHKLRNVYTTVYQNFLLLIDQLLSNCNANPKSSVAYVSLRKLIVKKLKNNNKMMMSNRRITMMRQGNEVNLLVIKKICRVMSQEGITPSQSPSTATNSSFDPQMSPALAHEYKLLGDEMLDLLRNYDKMTIVSIIERLNIKQRIHKMQQISNNINKSPFKRQRSTNQFNKVASPRLASPRITNYYGSNNPGSSSPAHSNKSYGKSSDNSNSSQKNKSKFSQKRTKMTKPVAFEYKEDTNRTKNNLKDKEYDVVEEYTKESRYQQPQQQNNNNQFDDRPRQNPSNLSNSMFYLPESMAFILSNSIECNNGITNINNNINIYNSSNVDMNQLKQEASNAKLIGSINPRTGELTVQSKPSQVKSVSRIPFVKRGQQIQQLQQDSSYFAKGSQSPSQTGFNRHQNALVNNSPKKTTSSSKLNQSTTGIGQGIKSVQRQRVSQSRQQITRDTSQLDISLKEDVPSSVALSRETSKISQQQPNIKRTTFNNSQGGGKSVNVSPSKSKKLVTSRPVSRQIGIATTVKKAQIVEANSGIMKNAGQSKQVVSRPMSRQVMQGSQSKKGLGMGKDKTIIANDSKRDLYNQSSLSVAQTPLKKDKPSDYISQNSSLTQEKLYQPILSGAKKQQQQQLVVSPYIPQSKSKSKQNNQVLSQKKPQKTSVVQSKPQSNIRVKKESLKFQEQIQSSDLNLVGFEVDSSQDEQRFYTEKKTNKREQYRQDEGPEMLKDIEPYPVGHKSAQTEKHKDNIQDEYENIFRENESRLDKLLDQMAGGTHDTHSSQPHNNEDFSHPAKQIKFGSLIDSHIGSFDLKREMEKLKQLDEQQKRQRKISVKINTHTTLQNSHSEISGVGNQMITSESPTKRILLGEFDETKDDEEQLYLNLGDDLLLSNDSQKQQVQVPQQQLDVPIEVFDFQDYITQKTGMEDPFPDHQDPHEETSPAKQQVSQEDQDRRKNDEEIHKLRSSVKIPYLPDLSEKEYEETYTLVLDLDETLIHFECEEEDECQDEDEQGYYLIRPGAIKFLNELSKYYELVIFTAAMPDYADWILDNVDRHRIIKHRLYRQHTTPHEDYAIKDLRNLGRSLQRTIIIDNLAENFVHTTPDNGIWVESWYDDMDDTVLELLIPFLKEIVTHKVKDVRQVLNKETKEKCIYRCLEEGKDIPRVAELMDMRNGINMEKQITTNLRYKIEDESDD